MNAPHKRSKSEVLKRYWSHVKETSKFSNVSLKEARAKYATYIKVRNEYRKQAAKAKKANDQASFKQYKELFNESVAAQRKREGYLPVPETDYFTGESPD